MLQWEGLGLQPILMVINMNLTLKPVMTSNPAEMQARLGWPQSCFTDKLFDQCVEHLMCRIEHLSGLFFAQYCAFNKIL